MEMVINFMVDYYLRIYILQMIIINKLYTSNKLKYSPSININEKFMDEILSFLSNIHKDKFNGISIDVKTVAYFPLYFTTLNKAVLESPTFTNFLVIKCPPSSSRNQHKKFLTFPTTKC